MKSATGKTKDMTLIALFAGIIAICSWIAVPTVIPFTMQTFGVFFTLGVLGGKRGTVAICVYLLLGLVGIPVYANGTSGIGILLGPAGGYMIAWIISGFILWSMEKIFGNRTWVLPVSMLLGLLVCYVLGTLWFSFVYTSGTEDVGLWTAFTWCVMPFIIPDLIKIALALALQKRLTPFLK